MAQDFLGRGIVSPLRRSGASDFENAEGSENLKSAVREVLGTIGGTPGSPGELPWDTQFGSRLHFLKHKNADEELEDFARIFVVEALQSFEPRVIVTGVEVEAIPDENKLLIRVFFVPISDNVPENKVFLKSESQSVEVSI